MKQWSAKPTIVTITGTKGKTTISRGLSHIYTSLKYNTLLVDTDGHYVNGKQKSTLQDSMRFYELVPTNAPGKFLYELNGKDNAIAILEAAIGSSNIYGIGYGSHTVGVLTNVFEDHIGARIKNKAQLAHEKARIAFKPIDVNGYAVFNADDRYVTKHLDMIPAHKNITLVPFGLDLNCFNATKHLKNGGVIITLADNWVVARSHKSDKKIIRVNDIEWTFEGLFTPSLYNLMAICGALYGLHRGKIPAQHIKALTSYRFDPNGGRLTRLFNRDKSIQAIVDYAHEKQSLREVADLAKRLATGRTIGVVRLAPDRLNDVIRETGAYIANRFDHIIVYDKIDGVTRKEYKGKKQNIHRAAGEVSGMLFKAIRTAQKGKRTVEHRIVEEDAVRAAMSAAQPGDVIVHICNDDHARSVRYVKNYLKQS